MMLRFLLVAAIGFVSVVASYGQAVTWMRTSSGGDKNKVQSLTFHPTGTAATATITVNPSQTYQTMVGFGGSFTEAGAVSLKTLNATVRKQATDAYFGPTGADYSICRTQIGASDFSAGLYSYDDQAGDNALNNFSVQHDVTSTLIQWEKDALANNPTLKIFGSPWSAPAWMKQMDNGAAQSMDNGGTLLSSCASAWANYFVKYVQAYKALGVPIWGITIQNEPQAKQTWPSMIFSKEQERDFMKNYLGPTLKNASLGPSVLNVMFWDHNKDVMVDWANTFYADTAVKNMVWGEAIHWYSGDAFNNVATVYNNYPGKHILATEQCITGFTGAIDYANTAEKYAHDIFGDIVNGSEGWVDWNMVLNTQGGPNVSSNWCLAGILVNTGAGTIQFTPIYYYMVQFSKYCHTGAVRIGTTISNGSGLEAMSFKNTDGSMTTIVHNYGNSTISCKLVSGTNQVEFSSTALSVETFNWNPNPSGVKNQVVTSSLSKAESAKRRIIMNQAQQQQIPGTGKFTVTGKKLPASVNRVSTGLYIDKPDQNTQPK